MVVVVVLYIASVNYLWRAAGKVKFVYQSITVINKRFAIGQLVGGLYGVGYGIDDLPPAGRNVQQFQVTA